MYKLFSSLSILACLCLFSSCCKKRVYCTSGDIKLAFTGFTRAETRTIVLKRYEIGNKYAKALDSARLVYSGNSPIKVNKPDTVWLSEYTLTSGLIKSIVWGNEWSLELPANGRWFAVHTIGNVDHRFEMTKCSDDSHSCTNDISGFMVGGGYYYGNTAYINK